MNASDNFYSLLIRGEGLSKDEQDNLKNVYRQYGRDKMFELLKTKKILPFGANAFVNYDLDADYWRDISESYTIRNTKILNCLDEAYAALAKSGVKKMFVSENFAALLSSKGNLSLFASGDVDNYADPCEKEKIYKAFEALGYTRKERLYGKHQIAAEFFPPAGTDVPEKFYISVDFYPLARLKLPCCIDAEKFVRWDEIHTFENTHIVLPPHDALMYICLLHISLHSFSRAPDIRLYIDLLNMVKTAVDYKTIANWCERDNTRVRAAVAADISNKLMKTEIPQSITDLAPGKKALERLVYDQDKKDLIYEPHDLKVLRIEIMCHDNGALSGLAGILFPDKSWMCKSYGSSGVKAHLKHIIGMI